MANNIGSNNETESSVLMGTFFDCGHTLFETETHGINFQLLAYAKTLREFGEKVTIITGGSTEHAENYLSSHGYTDANVQSKKLFEGKTFEVLYDDKPAEKQGLKAIVQKDPTDTNFMWKDSKMEAAYQDNIVYLTELEKSENKRFNDSYNWLYEM